MEKKSSRWEAEMGGRLPEKGYVPVIKRLAKEDEREWNWILGFFAFLIVLYILASIASFCLRVSSLDNTLEQIDERGKAASDYRFTVISGDYFPRHPGSREMAWVDEYYHTDYEPRRSESGSMVKVKECRFEEWMPDAGRYFMGTAPECLVRPGQVIDSKAE